MAAGPGPDATGVGLATSALRAAEQEARDRGRTARFVRWDALRLAEPGEPFDTLPGCGLFPHLFGGDDRAANATGPRAWLAALTRT